MLFLRIAVKGASIPADATIERFTQIKGPLLRAIRAELEGPEAAAVALKIAALYPPAATPGVPCLAFAARASARAAPHAPSSVHHVCKASHCAA